MITRQCKSVKTRKNKRIVEIKNQAAVDNHH